MIMPKKKYTAEFKTKIVLSVLDGSKELNRTWFSSGLLSRSWRSRPRRPGIWSERLTDSPYGVNATCSNWTVQAYTTKPKSRWADNILIERWFRSLKTEQIYPNDYKSPRELRRLINDYIHDYNTVRPHENLGYRTLETVYNEYFATPQIDIAWHS